MGDHSTLSPSSSWRWLNCTGSLMYRSEGTTSAAAEEGTKAHKIAESILKSFDNAMVERAKVLAECDGEMREAIQIYLDFVRDRETISTIKQVEHKVTMTSMPEVFGTVDCVVFDLLTGKLSVIDFKYGAGVAVSAYQNSQLGIYALALAEGFSLTESIELCIVQPRSPDGLYYNVWTTDVDELKMLFWGRLEAARLAVETESYSHVPGGWCQWCPGAADCPAVKAAQDEALELASKVDITDWTPERIGRILDAEKGVSEAYKQLKARAYELAIIGVDVPGYKLVRSLGNRVWADEDNVKKRFGVRKCTEQKLLSPAQLTKAFPEMKSWIDDNVIRPDRGLQLVKNSDRREAVDYIKALEVVEVVDD